MDFHIIKQPSQGVVRILESRSLLRDFFQDERFDTIGLVQGKLGEMLVAADIAEKAAHVQALEIKGSCPQQFTLLALFGSTASVAEALDQIQEHLQKGV